MDRKVLIIGCTGTLGQALIGEFKSRGYDVTGWDKVDVDITSPTLEPKVLELKPDIIINATAYNSVDKMEVDDGENKLARKINAEAPGRLAKIAKKLNAVMVHYSSNYVFDGENKAGYKEDDKPNPINKYGESKLAGEKNTEKVNGKYYIIRLSRLFGVRGTAETSKRTFIEIMQAELDKSELEVGNTETSALTYAPDLAKLTREIIESKKPFGIYHGTNEGECTW